MREGILLAGFGGQGIMFAGQLLAYAAMDHGFNVTWIPSYGPEMRGGTANCFVVISDQVIGAPVSPRPETVLIFNLPSFDKFEPTVAPGGLLVVNASLVNRQSVRDDITQLAVPATELADEIGDKLLTNMVMLGVMLTLRPILEIDALKETLDHHIPPHRRNKLANNLRALDSGIAVAHSAKTLMPAHLRQSAVHQGSA
jgi:2-oxoglutarate ferredoxin oxidoreductase subunit gamma